MSDKEKVKITIETDNIKKVIEGDYMFGGVITEHVENIECEAILVGEREPMKVGVEIAKVASRILDALPEDARLAYTFAVIQDLEDRRNEKQKKQESEEQTEKDLDKFGEILGNKAFKK